MAHLKGRVGLLFQFTSEHYRSTALEKAVHTACKRAEEELGIEFSASSISYSPLRVDGGKYLFELLKGKIDKCDVLVVELSDLNKNVILELGYALGRRREIIIYVHRTSSSEQLSDLQGFVTEKYSEIEDIQAHLAHQLTLFFRSKWRTATEDINSLELYSSIWNFRQANEVFLVSGEVPQPPGPPIVQLGDKDAFSSVAVALSHLFPELSVRRYSCSSLPASAYSANIVAVGGPNSNTVTNALLKSSGVELSFPRVKKGWKVAGHHPKIVMIGGEKGPIQPVYGQAGIEKEVLFIGAGPNPLNQDARIITLFGLHTYGVLGAATAVVGTRNVELDRANLAFLADNLASAQFRMFCCDVRLVNGECVIPKLSDYAKAIR